MPEPCRFPVVPAPVCLPVLAAAQQTTAQAAQGPDAGLGAAVTLLVQLVFLLVPASLVMQVVALRKLEGRLLKLAQFSACAMAALWLFVIVTGLAGSNLSPIWLVFLSPFFVLFLAVLLLAHSRSGADDDSLSAPPPRQGSPGSL